MLMLKKQKNILVVSNPFGYGPTGQAIAIIEEFKKREFKRVHLIFALSKFEEEIIDKKDIGCVRVDTRSAQSLKEILVKTKCTYVFSSQNRFAIHAAKELGLTCAFLDGLSWFWNNFPEDYLLADRIYQADFFDTKDEYRKNILNVGMVVSVPSQKLIGNKVIIHIGGCKYPRIDRVSKNWLKLLAVYLNLYKGSKQLAIYGGKEAIKILSNLTENEEISFFSASHNRFVHDLAQASQVITVGGETASFESLALGCPLSFLLPMNLSQLALVQRIKSHGFSLLSLDWSDYSKNMNELSQDEFIAITQIEDMAQGLLEDPKTLEKYINDMNILLSSEPKCSDQHKLLETINIDGAHQIVEDLSRLWELS